MTETLTGGCQCGRVRYEADVDDLTTAVCHCRMCQRATGGPYSALMEVRKDRLRWTGAAPDWYRSSPIAKRGFCRECGSPLAFTFVEDTDMTELMLGSFDDPYRLSPANAFAIERRHEAYVDIRALPGKRSDENENVTKRWEKAGGECPD